MGGALLFGLILYPFILALFSKGIWFEYLYLSGIFIQFIMSSN